MFCDNDKQAHPIKNIVSPNNKQIKCLLPRLSIARQRMDEVASGEKPCRTVLNARMLLRQLQQDDLREKAAEIKGVVPQICQGRRNSHPTIDLCLPICNISNQNASKCSPVRCGPLEAPEFGKGQLLDFSPNLSHRRRSTSVLDASPGLPMTHRQWYEGDVVNNGCRTSKLEGCIYNKNSDRRWSVDGFLDFENNGRRRSVGHIEGQNNRRRLSIGHIEGQNERRLSVGHIEGNNNGRRLSVGHIEGQNNERRLSVGHIEGQNNGRRLSVGHIEGQNNGRRLSVGHIEGQNNGRRLSAGHIEGNISGRRLSVGHTERKTNGRRLSVGHIEGNNNGRRLSVGHIEGQNNERRLSVGHIEGKINGRRLSVGHIEGNNNGRRLSVAHIEGNNNGRRRSVGHIEGNRDNFVEQDAAVKARIADEVDKKRSRGAPGYTEQRIQARNNVTLKMMKWLAAARERMDTQTLLEIKRLQTGQEY